METPRSKKMITSNPLRSTCASTPKYPASALGGRGAEDDFEDTPGIFRSPPSDDELENSHSKYETRKQAAAGSKARILSFKEP